MSDVAEDRGALGQANLSRPSVIETVATGSTRIGQEKADAKRYTDAHLFDRLHACGQLWDSLWMAAERVLEIWGDAGLEPKQSGSYAPRGWVHGHDDESDDFHTAMEEFRRLLGGCSSAHASILHHACLGHHPGVPHLATLQAALGDLAKKWGMG